MFRLPPRPVGYGRRPAPGGATLPPPPAPEPPPGPPPAQSESLLVSSLSADGATTKATLTEGTDYTVIVSGTWSAWDAVLNMGEPQPVAQYPTTGERVSTETGLDADTIFAWPYGTNHTSGHFPNFQIDAGSGFEHVEPDGGPYETPQEGNRYTYTIAGQGHPVSFRIYDPIYDDNYGSLLVTVRL